MSDNEKETVFTVFWESRGSNTMGAKRLGELHFDFASWSNLLAVLLGQSRFAEMTARPSGSSPRRCKVMLAHGDGAPTDHTTYQNLQH